MITLSRRLVSAATLLLLSAIPSTRAQSQWTSTHNVTDLEGTWCTGSCHVQTGSGFANPVLATFNYPLTSGISYSFTDDGYFEEAQYRFSSNGSNPSCITAVLIFQHGVYDLLDNGSMILTPFGSDGRMQVQDSCAAVTNQIMLYNTTEMMLEWRIFAGPSLQLYQFDGSPLAPMQIVYKPPNMLPTQPLTNYSDPDIEGEGSPTRRDLSGLRLEKRAGAGRSAAAALGGLSVVAAAAGLGLML